jgi:DNA-binding FadR family transcriptional regulator
MKVPRKTDYARQQILEAIRNGLFAVGERLPPERELAALLGIGRSSVREALSMLQIAGIVEVRHGAGVFVRGVPDSEQPDLPLDIVIAEQDFLTVTQARYVIERGLVALAIDAATRKDAAALSAGAAAMEQAAQQEDISRFLDANIHFHKALAQAGHNPILAAFSLKLLDQLRKPNIKSIRTFFYQVEASRLAQAALTHRRLADAIAAGDRETALAAIYRHYADVVAPLIGSDPSWR